MTENFNADEIKELSDIFHRVLFDSVAIEKRCVPSRKILDETLLKIRQNINNFTIDKLSNNICKVLFDYVQSKEPQLLPVDEIQIEKIVTVFKFIAFLNKRSTSIFDEDDLWGLYILKNIMTYKDNPEVYLDAFQKWENRHDDE